MYHMRIETRRQKISLSNLNWRCVRQGLEFPTLCACPQMTTKYSECSLWGYEFEQVNLQIKNLD